MTTTTTIIYSPTPLTSFLNPHNFCHDESILPSFCRSRGCGSEGLCGLPKVTQLFQTQVSNSFTTRLCCTHSLPLISEPMNSLRLVFFLADLYSISRLVWKSPTFYSHVLLSPNYPLNQTTTWRHKPAYSCQLHVLSLFRCCPSFFFFSSSHSSLVALPY